MPATHDDADPLAEELDQKGDEVLEREGVEQELMDRGRSDAGEQIAGAEDDPEAAIESVEER